jgi:hypothetical protein
MGKSAVTYSRLALAALVLGLAAPQPVFAQGMAAGERARGEGRCPLGTVAEAMPGGYRCAAPGAPPPQSAQAPASGQGSGAAGGQAREVSRGELGAWLPFAAGAAAVVGVGIAAVAGQGGSTSAPSGTQ